INQTAQTVEDSVPEGPGLGNAPAVRIGRLRAVPGRRIGGRPSARPAVAYVRGQRRVQHLDGLQPQRSDAVEDPLAGPEQDRGDVERELVDDPGDERLPNGGGA